MSERQLAARMNGEACEFFNSRVGGLFFIANNIDFAKNPLGELRKFTGPCLLIKVYSPGDYDSLCIHNLKNEIPNLPIIHSSPKTMFQTKDGQ